MKLTKLYRDGKSCNCDASQVTALVAAGWKTEEGSKKEVKKEPVKETVIDKAKNAVSKNSNKSSSKKSSK